MDDIYENITKNTPDEEQKILILFDDLIWLAYKLNSVVTEWFIGGRKINIFLVFITQSYFNVPKVIRLNYKQYFIIDNPNKQEPLTVLNKI